MTFNKPTEWGSRFHFPENVESNSDDLMMSVTEKLCVQMVDNYETAVAEEIASAARSAGVTDCTVLNKKAILDALNKQIPTKPLHIHEVYPTHDWNRDDDGEIDTWAMCSDFHNGPLCRRCYHSPCVHCDPNWEDGECVVDEDHCPSCNKNVSRHIKFCSECGQALDWGNDNA